MASRLLQTATSNITEPRICEAGGTGLFMPRAYEHEWDKSLRAAIYLIFLGWCFFGVMVVSDVFMAAIEKITSAKKRLFNKETNRYQTVLIWNPTIANLSLMALGSSAPEILLSVIEIVSGDFFAGSLGPSTIVGSAAFNLFCIIAVCIVAIPEGEVRYIKETQVYVVTASFSVFAYLWLIVILVLSTPDVVEIWEGVLTFLFFPILLIIAYMADRGMFPGTTPLDHSAQIQGMSKEELAERRAALQKEYGDGITDEQIVKLLQVESQAKNYASNKIAARRTLMGGKRAAPVKKPTGLHRAMSALSFGGGNKKVVPIEEEEKEDDGGGPSETKARIEFKMIKVAILESAGHVNCVVCREGAMDHAVTVDYKTEEGSAKETSDYDRAEGTLKFEKGETEKTISVKIIDDVAFEEDEEFYIVLSNAQVATGNEAIKDVQCSLGAVSKTTVVIIDDDMPGEMAFEKDSMTMSGPAKDDTTVDITVIRQNGSAGKIGCSFKTENGTAVAGIDYEETSGSLEFEDGEMTKTIKVVLKAKGRYDRTEFFRIILDEPQAPGKFDAKADGAPDTCILTVMLETGKESKQEVDRIMSSLQSSWEKSKVGHANWADQFKNAFYVMGGEDDDGEDEEMKPGVSDWVFHIITLPWKLFFALIPPTDYCGGWLCFVCALGMIGLLTGLIGDLAALFGCCAGLKDEIAAITVVALGTSLPDTFASKAAAVMDKHADNSVGNVTGSNSVNVFLGLGLPWMMASIFWATNGRSEKWETTYAADQDEAFYNTELCKNGCFVVKAGSLVFSVTVFSVCATCAILILFLRRKFLGGELGGPRPQAIASSILMASLWLVYVSLSWWYAETQ